MEQLKLRKASFLDKDGNWIIFTQNNYVTKEDIFNRFCKFNGYLEIEEIFANGNCLFFNNGGNVCAYLPDELNDKQIDELTNNGSLFDGLEYIEYIDDSVRIDDFIDSLKCLIKKEKTR